MLCANAAGATPLLVYELPGTGFETNPVDQWSLYSGPSNWSSKEDLNKMISAGVSKWSDRHK